MWRLFLRVFTVVSLAVIAIGSGRYAIADYYYEKAKSRYDASNLRSFEFSSELQPFIDVVDRALTWRRSHADALDFKADLLYRSWWLSPDGQYLDQSALLQRAVRLHKEALNLRRNWSYSSARLALIYSHQAKLGKEFDKWFLETHRLGLYETSIAKSLMTIGLQKWSQLNKRQQDYTMDFIRVSIEQKANSPEAMAILLDRYKKRAEICLNMPNKTPRAIAVCTKLESNAQRLRSVQLASV